MSNMNLIAQALTQKPSVPMPRSRPQRAIAEDLLRQGVIDQSSAESMAGNFANLPPENWERVARAEQMFRSGQMSPQDYEMYMSTIGRR